VHCAAYPGSVLFLLCHSGGISVSGVRYGFLMSFVYLPSLIVVFIF